MVRWGAGVQVVRTGASGDGGGEMPVSGRSADHPPFRCAQRADDRLHPGLARVVAEQVTIAPVLEFGSALLILFVD